MVIAVLRIDLRQHRASRPDRAQGVTSRYSGTWWRSRARLTSILKIWSRASLTATPWAAMSPGTSGWRGRSSGQPNDHSGGYQDAKLRGWSPRAALLAHWRCRAGPERWSLGASKGILAGQFGLAGLGRTATATRPPPGSLDIVESSHSLLKVNREELDTSPVTS